MEGMWSEADWERVVYQAVVREGRVGKGFKTRMIPGAICPSKIMEVTSSR